jgi:RNA polymerase sigma-70 factor (ECF subfamily)
LDSTKNLISELKKGNSEAYKIFFETFYNRLYAYAFKYVQDHFAAEEIVENTMFILWEKRKKLGNIENIKSYLYTIVRNASLDYIKLKNKKTPFNIESHDVSCELNSQIVEEEVHALLIDALNSLPDKCRKVFELSCLEGLKYKEIAEDMQISLNTVKSQRARAIQLLKIRLKDTPLLLVLLGVL